MLSNNKKLIAVIGATGQQGGGVVRALQASGEFKVRALTRAPQALPPSLDRLETRNSPSGIRTGSQPVNRLRSDTPA